MAGRVYRRQPTGTGYCNGFTVNYQNVSFGPDLQGFYWDFGDPATLADTSNIQNPSYTFPGIGDYTVTLIANPGSPCADTAHEVFHIAPLLSPDFLYPSAQCLNGNSFDYTAGGTFQGTGTFQWNFGADAIPSTSTATYVPNVHYTTAGTHTVSFMVAENACTATTTKTIQVYANPEAQIGNFNPSGCVPQTINFNNLSTASSTMAYNWSFSDGTTSTLLNPVKTFSIPGVYSVSLTVHTSENCIDSSKVVSVNNLTVFAVPAANFNYTSATANCFTNNSFNFTSSSTFAGTTGVLNWSFGSTATPSVSSANLINNLIYNSVGFYTVTLVAAENGCKDSTKQYVSLYANPLAAISNPTIAGCNPQTLVFNNTSTSSSDLYYQWMFSNGQTSIEKNPTVVFSPSGIYSYTLMVYTIDKCIDKSYVYGVNSITVSPSPISIFTADPLVVSIFEPLITFQDTSTIDVVSWLYDFGTGDTSSLKNPIYTYATWGNYTVTETVTNQFNCSATSKVLIRILPEHRFFIPDAFTPGNYDELNDVFKPIVMGVKEYKFYIFDRWGEQIFKSTDIDEGWNGKYQGVICKQDVYVWKCDFRNIVTNKEEHHVGHVTLVR